MIYIDKLLRDEFAVKADKVMTAQDEMKMQKRDKTALSNGKKADHIALHGMLPSWRHVDLNKPTSTPEERR